MSVDPHNKVIKTEFIFPPIPVRHYDWQAWYEDEEETQCFGYGTTKAEAIKDLIDTFPKCE